MRGCAPHNTTKKEKEFLKMKKQLVVKKVLVCSSEGEPLYVGEKTKWKACFWVPRWLGSFKVMERERRARVLNEIEACKWLCENTPAGELRTLALKRYCELSRREGVDQRRECL